MNLIEIFPVNWFRFIFPYAASRKYYFQWFHFLSGF